MTGLTLRARQNRPFQIYHKTIQFRPLPFEHFVKAILFPMVSIEPKEIVATLRESLLVLTEDLVVEYASARFLETFGVSEDETLGQCLIDLGNGQWNIPRLVELLSSILDQKTTIEDYEVEHTFEHIGRKIMRLNARKTVRPGNGSRRILLAIEDVTAAVDTARAAEYAADLSHGIVNTIREPLLVLDDDLNVVTASRSFLTVFKVKVEETVGKRIWELGNGQWAIPELIHLLTTVIPGQSKIEGFEVTHNFPDLGERSILLNARTIYREEESTHTLLLAMEDVTEKRRADREREDALAMANDLLEELNHRVMNSLTMIASIVSLEARSVDDARAQRSFERLTSRVFSVASLYQKLSAKRSIEHIDAEDYFGAIIQESQASVARDGLDLQVDYKIDPIALSTQTAVPLGLIVNEVVTNSMKYAFDGRNEGQLSLSFKASDDTFELEVWDDGVGIDKTARVDSGMGQRLVSAFTTQLSGTSRVESGADGTKFVLSMPRERQSAPQ